MSAKRNHRGSLSVVSDRSTGSCSETPLWTQARDVTSLTAGTSQSMWQPRRHGNSGSCVANNPLCFSARFEKSASAYRCIARLWVSTGQAYIVNTTRSYQSINHGLMRLLFSTFSPHTPLLSQMSLFFLIKASKQL